MENVNDKTRIITKNDKKIEITMLPDSSDNIKRYKIVKDNDTSKETIVEEGYTDTHDNIEYELGSVVGGTIITQEQPVGPEPPAIGEEAEKTASEKTDVPPNNDVPAGDSPGGDGPGGDGAAEACCKGRGRQTSCRGCRKY